MLPSLITVQRDLSGTMGFNEFKELWSVLNGWRQHFISFDSDRSGTIDPQELQKALTAMGADGEEQCFFNFQN